MIKVQPEIKMICPDCLGQLMQDCLTCDGSGLIVLIDVFGFEKVDSLSNNWMD